ncbi:SRPBCC family protein [uncultured Jatrophihabitans sp.]|uniref:SRPBCC family protein n=1 Tax=uncultured Jatrophihabitans sp. TaxID=1610747 RepID=UPI0035CBD7A7
MSFRALPLSPGKTLMRSTWLVREDAVEGVDYDVAELTDTWRHTNRQDAALVARAQLGVSSPTYEPGPYTLSEYQVESFCVWYRPAA